MAKSLEARNFLLKCGESLALNDGVLDVKYYVVRYVYGDVRSSSLDMARAAKWKRMKKISDAPASQ